MTDKNWQRDEASLINHFGKNIIGKLFGLSAGRRGGFVPKMRGHTPNAQYDAVIMGAGAHGLAAAYQLAKRHGISKVAVMDAGLIGARNSFAANECRDDLAAFYGYGKSQWQSVDRELAKHPKSPRRGIMNLCHTAEEFDDCARKGNVLRTQGEDALLCDYGMVVDLMPHLNFDHNAFPIYGGLWRKNTASVEDVMWRYARSAEQASVDIIEDCAITGFIIKSGVIKGVKTTCGNIMAAMVGLTDASDYSKLAEIAEIDLPMKRHDVQFVESERLAPCLSPLLTFGKDAFAVAQMHNGALLMRGEVMGDDNDATYLCSNMTKMLPQIAHARIHHIWQERQYVPVDHQPIMSKTGIDGLFINVGWGDNCGDIVTGSGLCFAQLMVSSEAVEPASAFTLDRFQ